MSLIDALLDEYIIRCSIVGGCIDCLLNCSIATLANNGIEAIHLGNSLMLSVQFGINLAVSHTIQEHLQVRISASAELSAIRGIVRIQAHLSLIGIRQSVAVSIDNSTVVAIHLQTGIAGDVDFLVVSSIITLVECSKLIVQL